MPLEATFVTLFALSSSTFFCLFAMCICYPKNLSIIQECLYLVVCVGNIPIWFTGTLLRNGPGLQRIGKDEYRHLFDGLALMQQFKIGTGKVVYRNKFLRSDSYKRNMKAQRIVVSEFGTRSHRDPCTTFFDRFTTYFTMGEVFSDNDLVGFYEVGICLKIASCCV